jgi:hypothetical protein
LLCFSGFLLLSLGVICRGAQIYSLFIQKSLPRGLCLPNTVGPKAHRTCPCPQGAHL